MEKDKRQWRWWRWPPLKEQLTLNCRTRPDSGEHTHICTLIWGSRLASFFGCVSRTKKEDTQREHETHWPKKKDFCCCSRDLNTSPLLPLSACALNRNHLFGINLLHSLRQLSCLSEFCRCRCYSLSLFAWFWVSNLSLLFFSRQRFCNSSFHFQLCLPKKGRER